MDTRHYNCIGCGVVVEGSATSPWFVYCDDCADGVLSEPGGHCDFCFRRFAGPDPIYRGTGGDLFNEWNEPDCLDDVLAVWVVCQPCAPFLSDGVELGPTERAVAMGAGRG